jgi:hypothetical protein
MGPNPGVYLPGPEILWDAGAGDLGCGLERGRRRGGRRLDRAVVSGDGARRRPGGQGQEQGPRPRTQDSGQEMRLPFPEGA